MVVNLTQQFLLMDADLPLKGPQALDDYGPFPQVRMQYTLLNIIALDSSAPGLCPVGVPEHWQSLIR